MEIIHKLLTKKWPFFTLPKTIHSLDVNVCAMFCERTSPNSIWILMTGQEECGDR